MFRIPENQSDRKDLKSYERSMWDVTIFSRLLSRWEPQAGANVERNGYYGRSHRPGIWQVRIEI